MEWTVCEYLPQRGVKANHYQDYDYTSFVEPSFSSVIYYHVEHNIFKSLRSNSQSASAARSRAAILLHDVWMDSKPLVMGRDWL